MDLLRDNRHIFVSSDGPPDGDPILVVHGGPGFSHGYMRPWLQTLAVRRRLVCFDLPGAGRSSRQPGSGYPLEEYLADVRAVQDSVLGRPTALLAHAWGAILAVEHALLHPDAVSAVILVNPLRILTAESQDHEAQARMIQAVDPDVVQRYVSDVYPNLQRALAGDLDAWHAVDTSPWWARMWKTQFASAPPSGWDEAAVGIGWGLEAYFAHKGRAMLSPDEPLAQYDLAERAAHLTVPVLIVGCAHDANYVAMPRIHAEPLARAIPHVEVVILDGVGHFPFVERPAEFGEFVNEFLGRRVAGRTPSR